MTKYVQCKFGEHSPRTYTYAWDGEEPLAPGDRVEVKAPRDEGKMIAIVVAVTDRAPSFKCKPILGKAPPKPEKEEGSPA